MIAVQFLQIQMADGGRRTASPLPRPPTCRFGVAASLLRVALPVTYGWVGLV